MSISSFNDLTAWQEAHKYVLMIYKCTREFPQEEMFGLTQQLRRAGVSITSNIAEGFSRQSKKEKSQFYHTSLGSLSETQNQLLIAKDIGYILIEKYDEIHNQSITVSKLLNGLIKSVLSRPPT